MRTGQAGTVPCPRVRKPDDQIHQAEPPGVLKAAQRREVAGLDLDVGGQDLVTFTPALVEDLDRDPVFGGLALNGESDAMEFIIATVALETVDRKRQLQAVPSSSPQLPATSSFQNKIKLTIVTVHEKTRLIGHF